jgi:hypothetical protein
MGKKATSIKGNLPQIKLKISEKLWLEKAYQAYKDGVPVSFKQIRVSLIGKIPNNFHPATIDERLIDSAGEKIKILGIVAVEGNENVLKKCDDIILSAKRKIVANPEIEQIETEQIAEEIGSTKEEISKLLYLIYEYAHFYQGYYAEQGSNVISRFSISGNDSIFYNYMQFSSMKETIIAILKGRADYKRKYIDYTDEPKNKIQNGRIIISPIFHSRVTSINPKLCFVLMPFSTEWSERVYRNMIRKNIENLGIQCLRADDLSQQNIIESVWMGINQAAFVIAEMTGPNPNVMYETGIAHTLGKPSILITQDLSTIPFDLRHLRHVEYREHSDGEKKFRAELKKKILDLYQEYLPEVSIGKN